jgi:hypothetical protein
MPATTLPSTPSSPRVRSGSAKRAPEFHTSALVASNLPAWTRCAGPRRGRPCPWSAIGRGGRCPRCR